jgi:hypothetical protein
MGRVVMVVALVAAVLAGCGAGTPGSAGTGSSGVTGVVLTGPQCPVVQPDTPCPDRLAAGIVVRFTASDGTVTTTRTDADGRFRVSLVPGAYLADAVPDPAAGVMFAKPQNVVVAAGRYTTLQLAADTGVR